MELKGTEDKIVLENGETLEETIKEIKKREGWIFDKISPNDVEDYSQFSMFFYDGEDHMELIFYEGKFAKQFRHNIYKDELEIDTGIM